MSKLKPQKSDILLIQEIALSNVFAESMSFEYFQRKMQREYSKLFFTPLPQVQNLPFHDILVDLYENRFDEIKSSEDGEQELHDIAARVIDPDLDKKLEADLIAFTKKFQEAQKAAKTKEPPKAAPKEVKRVYTESPQAELVKKSTKRAGEMPKTIISPPDDGLDDLIDGIGSED